MVPLPSFTLRYTANILDTKTATTPRPRTALLMCQKKFSVIGNSAIGNYLVLCSKLILKTVLLEINYGKND